MDSAFSLYSFTVLNAPSKNLGAHMGPSSWCAVFNRLVELTLMDSMTHDIVRGWRG